MDENEKYARAKKQVKDLKSFYTHFFIYAAVTAFCFFIDFADHGNWWVQWVALGWGIAVFINGISVGFGIKAFGPDWEEKKIKEIMEKD